VLALGTIILELFGADSEGLAASITEVAKQTAYGDDGGGVVLSSALVGRIRNRTLRLVLVRCMDRDPALRLSASMAARALEMALQDQAYVPMDGHVFDASRDTPLVDQELEGLAAAEWDEVEASQELSTPPSRK